ncbi:hypothetical protein F2T21_20745 [Salmonella enterica]|nr:hypothetical protein [Salmonella enterica]EEF3421289.1 hypothetical protein [Salmonella enterica]
MMKLITKLTSYIKIKYKQFKVMLIRKEYEKHAITLKSAIQYNIYEHKLDMRIKMLKPKFKKTLKHVNEYLEMDLTNDDRYEFVKNQLPYVSNLCLRYERLIELKDNYKRKLLEANKPKSKGTDSIFGDSGDCDGGGDCGGGGD